MGKRSARFVIWETLRNQMRTHLTLRALLIGWVAWMCFAMMGCAHSRALSAADGIQLDVIAPPDRTQLLASASVVGGRLVLCGSVMRSRGDTIQGRVHVELFDPAGMVLAKQSIPLAVVGPRAQARRVFSWSYPSMPPAGSRISIRYRHG